MNNSYGKLSVLVLSQSEIFSAELWSHSIGLFSRTLQSNYSNCRRWKDNGAVNSEFIIFKTVSKKMSEKKKSSNLKKCLKSCILVCKWIQIIKSIFFFFLEIRNTKLTSAWSQFPYNKFNHSTFTSCGNEVMNIDKKPSLVKELGRGS